MEIVQNIENKLLGRKEVTATMNNDNSTPNRIEIKKTLAKQLKVDENLVIINKIINPFGSSNIKIKAKVYDSQESLEKNARPHMVKRNTVKVQEEVSE